MSTTTIINDNPAPTLKPISDFSTDPVQEVDAAIHIKNTVG